MKAILSKNPLLALVVVAALAAGTVLVAGYVDRPGPTAAPSKCSQCPNENPESCCAATGVCGKTQACVTACEKSACEVAPAAGGCSKAQDAPCASSGCAFQAASPCGAGGCSQTE